MQICDATGLNYNDKSRIENLRNGYGLVANLVLFTLLCTDKNCPWMLPTANNPGGSSDVVKRPLNAARLGSLEPSK